MSNKKGKNTVIQSTHRLVEAEAKMEAEDS